MSIQETIQSLAPGQLLEFFEVDLSPITGTSGPSDHLYFHDGVSQGGTAVVWQGATYQPWPITADGFDKAVKGATPRPKLTAGNANGVLTALCRDYDDLVGARVIRRRTFYEFLDGQPGADPGQHLPDDTFYVERKASHDKLAVSWELASAMDLTGAVLPSRYVIAGYCPSQYRGAECGYAGTSYFDVNDQPVGSLALDVCSKRVTGCKLRFGANTELPYGGFPAVRVYRV